MPKLVEPLGDAQLVVERERDVLGLAAVAQRRVVELLDSSLSAHRFALPSAPPRLRGAMKASCSARTASSTYLASTTTEILISEVEIIWMLMPSAASTSNMRAATPAWLRMPRPTIDTLATFGSLATPAAPISRAHRASTKRERLLVVSARHRERQVGRAVGAGVLDDHVDHDAGVGDRPEDARREARSIGHAQHRDLGLVAIEATPETKTSSMPLSSATTHVPSVSLKLDRTCTGTW